MTATTTLLEPSFVDLIAAIEQAPELSEQRRRHWVCSSRQIAKWLDRPAAVIPARWQAVRVSVAQLHHARVGVMAKTLANHRSNVRAALRWFRKEHERPAAGRAPFARVDAFPAAIGKVNSAAALQSGSLLLRPGIGPTSVNDTLFDQYWRYRAENTGRATNNTAKRFMVRAWNACVAAINGLPLQRLTEPPIKTAEPAWEKFPAGLRRDIDDYLAGFSKPHRTLSGKRIQPCRPSTIAYRRAELVAFCRTAVKLGVPIESLNCLGCASSPRRRRTRHRLSIGKRTATSRRPARSIWVGRSCEWPSRWAAWTSPRLTVSTRCGPHWNNIAARV